jgi:hypothetical protein
MTEQSRDALPSTCPACGARVRAGAPWCTQCYAPLRPGAVDEPTSAGRPAGPDERAEDDEPVAPPRVADPATAADPAEVERVAAQMLAELAAGRDEVRGLSSRLPSSPGARAALVAVVIVVATALLLLVMLVLGSLL